MCKYTRGWKNNKNPNLWKWKIHFWNKLFMWSTRMNCFPRTKLDIKHLQNVSFLHKRLFSNTNYQNSVTLLQIYFLADSKLYYLKDSHVLELRKCCCRTDFTGTTWPEVEKAILWNRGRTLSLFMTEVSTKSSNP